MRVFLVAGARPNFMKIAPIYRESLNRSGVNCRIVHTGQHYDHLMSQTFIEELEIPQPHHFLNSGSGTHSVQTARIMVGFEAACLEEHPDLVMVVGDVNSTLACSVTAKKLGIPVAHVEAGLRSFDLSMPEEINRMVTDSISDWFFVTEESGVENLLREGKKREAVHFVGHVMIDNLLHQLKRLEETDVREFPVHRLKETLGDYAFLTLHRPGNVDTPERLREIASALDAIAEDRPILFPVHPRTRQRMESFGLKLSPRINRLPPLGFMESLYLWKDATVVLTDSGGLQEETTALGVPCMTLRENTERPITLEMGTNILAGTRRESILDAYRKTLERRNLPRAVPPLWDGKASQRIWEALGNGASG
ncbi:MAG: UDP-N-acetylglucosamine 2-epimerase (non-hydrolyzing) [Deltaproteobacteria bacterium]|nr:UDP-N-acetylglucosamine 2-epimerase (non-hydrolyzing) [Deltaproteobacteria bacterium]